jgi:hypothetical protein
VHLKKIPFGQARHFAATVLFMNGIPDAMISKMTGHTSRELKKYQQLSPDFKKQTVERSKKPLFRNLLS